MDWPIQPIHGSLDSPDQSMNQDATELAEGTGQQIGSEPTLLSIIVTIFGLFVLLLALQAVAEPTIEMWQLLSL